ncbi:MAG TPA: hypothetical protein VMT68_07110 [Caulobacteraceae bacterium]|nr:hypothetical protein [Caulobacteraceae bacterium]
MPDNSFEFALERMFAEAPRRPDSDLFAARVLERLDRGWTARRALIGAMGVMGGLIGAGQLLGAGALHELAAFGARSNDYVTQHLPPELASLAAPAGLPAGAQAIWMAAALALVAAGFGVARLVREI